MKITADLLRKHNACSDHVRLFERHYPHGLLPTVGQLAVLSQLLMED